MRTNFFKKFKTEINQIDKTFFGFKRSIQKQLATLTILSLKIKQNINLNETEKSDLRRLISKKKLKILQEIKNYSLR